MLVGLVCALSCLSPAAAPNALAAAPHPISRADPYALRQRYLDALASLARNDIAGFQSQKAGLVGYALYPYLDYQDHMRRLRELTPSDVAAFRARWSTVPVADRLYDAWMDDLTERRAWDLFLANYEPSNRVDRQCDYLRALDRSGQHEAAMAPVEPLWMVGTSQPHECDSLFATWIERGHVTNQLVWNRLTLALQARSWRLARYLAGLLSRELARQGDLFYHVARDPTLIRNTSRFRKNNVMTRQIVEHGLRRLASIDPDAATDAWATYRETLSFNTHSKRVIGQDLAIGFARHGIVDRNADLSPSPDGRHLLVFEAQILASVTNQDWPTVISLIQRLDAEERTKQRWRYWLGRAQRALVAKPNTTTSAPWQDIAHERQYYGFLAAQTLGDPLALNDRPSRPAPDVVAALQQRPAMLRLRELYAIGDLADARREWAMLWPNLSGADSVAAAHVLADLGWINLSIMTANSADLRDDLSLRFPTPFTAAFIKESRASAVPINFLYGIARQESAFAPAARSPAGALGVMQLMPATAATTARNSGDPAPATGDLFDPAINIHIASRHIAELLARYDGNRVLTAAAYNAGAHRVDRWLHDRPARPADAWIETIPFEETRNYVKSVLAFAYVYGQRLGHPTPFLEADER